MNPFTDIFVRKPQKNNFDLSHDRKFSLNMGDLVPILCQEVIPGDRFNLQSEHLMRMAPMTSPVMHNINAYTHYFFVPNRLLWQGWEDFITGGEDGYSNPAFPTINAIIPKGCILDYLGLPITQAGNPITVSALPLQAYRFIYDEYYRDQNLQPLKKHIPVRDGDNTSYISQDFSLLKRAWEHDYFTSALPFAQKGPEVILPLGQNASLVFNKNAGLNTQDWFNASTGAIAPQGAMATDAAGSTQAGGAQINVDISKTHSVDLTTATSSTINELRKAFKLQEWLEANARGGSRYIEHIYNIFGVKSSDARLQRPEYLGGGKSSIAISEVLQTSGSPVDATGYTPTPLGEMGGHGINVGQSNDFTASFEEHGFIIGIMSIRPQSAYSQGIPKLFSKFDKFDYFYPQFSNIGEQEIKNKEVYVGAVADVAWREQTFGYVPRYSEYRFNHSTVHGDFRDTLEFWHMARKFGSKPALNAEFIEMDEINRIFAYEDNDFDHFYCHIYFNIKARRPLPLFNVPSI